MKKKVNILHIRTCKDTNLLSVLRKVVRYDSHLTHINGWFDFGSTLGYDWTSKMKKAAVAVMMIVVMCIGGSQAWGQTTENVTWQKNLTITLDCNKKYVITKNNNSPSDADADGSMTFTAPDGCKVLATLTSRSFGENGNGNKVDYLRLNNDPYWTNQTSVYASYESTSNTLTIQFNNRSNNTSSFVIEVVCWCTNGDLNIQNNGRHEVNCGQTYGFFDNGGPRNEYTNSTNQTYTFTSNGSIHIRFDAFRTEETASENYDNIKIYDGNTTTGTKLVFGCTGWTNGFNGAAGGFNNILSTGTTYTCTSGTMTIVWKSDRSYSAAGWAAKVWADGCCDAWDGDFSFSQNMVEMTTTSPNFIPTLTATPSVDYDVTYSVTSGTSVSIVNASSGEIHATSAGSSVVTATITPRNGDDEYCTITKTFTVNVACGELSITNNGRGCSETIDGICYIDTCASPGGRIRLRASTTMGGTLSYDWTWNAHNGGTDTVAHNEYVDISIASQRGIDVELTVHSTLGCSVTKHARIRVGGGIEVVHVIDDLYLGHICVGTTGQLIIGTGSGSAIQISQEPVMISANLGKAVQTFIPDGYCEGPGRCYSSVVEFTGFDANATVSNANDIEYVKLNIEHSHISDLQIKLECPDGRSAIILEDYKQAQNDWQGNYSVDAQDNYTYDWTNVCNVNGDNRICPIQFGTPNRTDDADHRCDSNYNHSGSANTYIWSNATGLGYVYAGGANSRVYNTQNLEDAGTWINPSDGYSRTLKRIKPSIESTPFSNVYMPRENLYTQLRTCHLNGEWKITVCDSWEGDNGYVFSWELGLSHSLIPTQWGFEDTVVDRTLECGADIHTYQHGDTLFVAPQWGDNASSCHVILTDNLGCKDTVSNTITFTLDSAWVNWTTNTGAQKQTYCLGDNSISPIGYTYGGKAEGITVNWKKDGNSIGSTYTSGTNNTNGIATTITSTGEFSGTVSISGTPTDPGVYTCDIATTQDDPCVSNHKYDTIIVYEKPKVNNNENLSVCPPTTSASVTVTGGTEGYNWTWAPTPTPAVSYSGNTATVTPSTTASYTVSVTDSHNCTSAPITVSVSHLEATIDFGD